MQQLGTAAVHLVTIAMSYMTAQSEDIGQVDEVLSRIKLDASKKEMASVPCRTEAIYVSDRGCICADTKIQFVCTPNVPIFNDQRRMSEFGEYMRETQTKGPTGMGPLAFCSAALVVV